MSMLPPPFERQMQALLGPEYPAFAAAMQEPAALSIRMNRAKWPPPAPPRGGEGSALGFISGEEQKQGSQHIHHGANKTKDELGVQANAALPPSGGPGGASVPWHPHGRYLDVRPVFTLDPRFHAGAYYVQEASSMFLHEAVRQTTALGKPMKVLDLCAAPGGKSTLLVSLLHPDSLLVSNEVVPNRVNVLRENLERWGYANVAVTSADAASFTALEGWFDLVVVDAPCSGEGLFRKDPDARNEWSLAQVEVCALRQRDILTAAFAALAPGGTLVYSTCTYNRFENEHNVAWMQVKLGMEVLSLDIPADWGIVAGGGGYHFFPHRLRGEGFFLSVLRKPAGDAPRLSAPAAFRSLRPLPKALLPEMQHWLSDAASFHFFQLPGDEVLALPAAQLEQWLVLDKTLRHKWFGLHVGQFKGRDFAPSHALALSTALSADQPRVAFSREQALLFLKKETFPLPPDTARGWALAAFEGLPLGWMKVLPNRMNNYLPPERRIRMSLHGVPFT